MASQLNADNADKGFMRILICCLRITNAYIHNGLITNPTERGKPPPSPPEGEGFVETSYYGVSFFRELDWEL